MGTSLKKLVINPNETPRGFHLTQMQDNIDLAITQISNSSFQNGTIVQLSLLSGQDNIVNHGLDREVQGWTVIDKDQDSNVWKSSTVNKIKNKQIILRVSANVSVKIYFF